MNDDEDREGHGMSQVNPKKKKENTFPAKRPLKCEDNNVSSDLNGWSETVGAEIVVPQRVSVLSSSSPSLARSGANGHF